MNRVSAILKEDASKVNVDIRDKRLPPTQKSHGTHSNKVSRVGSMVTLTRHQRLEGGDAIPIREEGASAAVILIARFLRHSIRPGIGQFALKAIIAKQHVGEAFAFS
jgi:hypothetical protein